MLTRRQFGVASLGLLAGCAAHSAEAPVEFAAGEGVNPFGLDLYGQLREKPGNIFISPSSIHTALAMTAAGAKGETLAQMTKVLHLGGGKPADLKTKGVELAIANAVWAQKGVEWEAAFTKVVTEKFHATLHDADFGQFEAERTRINAWVLLQTRDKIKDVLPPGVLDPDTRMVLVNAIYFKGAWATAFETNNTREQPFKKHDGSMVNVSLMHREGTIDYAKTDTVHVVRLPYQGNDVSFIGILPKKPEAFTDVEKSLTAERVAEWVKGLTMTRELPVWLPRFKVETEYSLKDPLKALGMTNAFSDSKADFRGMTTSQKLWVSAVVHKAFVEVNEAGTEAAAATGVVAKGKSASVDPPQFRADRPFLFALRHDPSGTLLFLGRFTGPQ